MPTVRGAWTVGRGQSCSAPFCTANVADGSFSSDRPAPDALGMSASLRSRPNLRTAANRRGVPSATYCNAANRILFDHLVGERERLVGNLETKSLRGLEQKVF